MLSQDLRPEIILTKGDTLFGFNSVQGKFILKHLELFQECDEISHQQEVVIEKLEKSQYSENALFEAQDKKIAFQDNLIKDYKQLNIDLQNNCDVDKKKLRKQKWAWTGVGFLIGFIAGGTVVYLGK